MAQMIFYDEPVAVNRDTHRTARLLLNAQPFLFANKSNSVLLAGEEAVHAMRHYPLLFIGRPEGPFTLAALTGLDTGQNLFVEANGQWKGGCYIPAFVRRYPFVMAEAADGGEMEVAVDAACPWVDLKGAYNSGQRLFDDAGNNTQVLDEILAFMASFHTSMVDTRQFGTLLNEMGLLVPRVIEIRSRKGSVGLDNFWVVDEERLLALDAASLKRLQGEGYLPWIYFHLASLTNVQRLADLLDQGPASLAAPVKPIQPAPKPF